MCLAVFLQVRTDISVFEFNIRFIGGFLSAYALSGDDVRHFSICRCLTIVGIIVCSGIICIS